MTTARKALLIAAVAVGVVAVALALWKIRMVIALIFVAMTVAAAMRPGVEALQARRIPRSVGVLLHYVALLGLVALLLWLIVPQAISQVEQALGGTGTHTQLQRAAAHTSGLEHQFLVGLDRRLHHLPSGTALIHPAVTVTKTALEVLAGILFTFAIAAYWIFERERAEDLVLSLLPPGKREVVRDTWHLIDAKLGAFVRAHVLMLAFVSTVLSGAFWALGLPYWLLLGLFAGIAEMIPVVGPLIGGGVAVAVALATQGWETAVLTAVAVYGLRLIQDYVINPQILGHAVGLSPLIVLVTVSVVGLLLGPFYVLLSVPVAAVLATVVDVVVRDRDPADQPTPTVIFSAKGREIA
jgi:predicted PurR-regulated permease PerM